MQLLDPTRPRRCMRSASGLLVTVVVLSCGGTEPMAPDPDPEPQNAIPVANAGPNQTVSTTLPVALDGSASTDAEGSPLTYAWSFSATPTGSAAAFDDATASAPTFTPDIAGGYTVQLVVSDGVGESAADEVVVTAVDNTSSAMIGSVGGAVASVDGLVELEIPAGALAADEEISLTLMPFAQRPDALTDVDDGAVMYEMRPDGLQFSMPARMTVTLPDSRAPDPGDVDVSVNPGIMASLSDGTLSLLDDQHSVIDAVTGTHTASADLEHFSTFVWVPLRLRDDSDNEAGVDVSAVVPEVANVDFPFPVPVSVATDFSFSFNAGDVSATLEDESIAPVRLAEEFDPAFVQGSQEALSLENSNTYECTEAGFGTWSADVTISLLDTRLAIPWVETPGHKTSVVTLRAGVTCLAPPTPFEVLELLSPEGPAFVVDESPGASVAILWATQDGAVLSDGDGQPSRRYTLGPTLTGARGFRAAGIASDGVVMASDFGILVGAGPIEPASDEIPFEAGGYDEPQPVPISRWDSGSRLQRVVPDPSAHATDVFVAGSNPETQRVVVVLFGDRNLAFLKPATSVGEEPGFVLDVELAEAFKDEGGSVFGGTRPVTAWVGPDGFDEEHPMLVVTISDAIQSSELNKVELVGGKAVLTPVSNVFPADEARHLKCLDGICALASYGSGFGFGSITYFTWDGQDDFQPIQGRAGRTIGIDMVRTESNSVLIASTGFASNTYTVDEISLSGEFIESTFREVPAECRSPGHVLFRSVDEVLLSCNGSGNAVSARPFG